MFNDYMNCFNPLPGVHPQGGNDPFEGEIDSSFQGTRQFPIEDYFGLSGGCRGRRGNRLFRSRAHPQAA